MNKLLLLCLSCFFLAACTDSENPEVITSILWEEYDTILEDEFIRMRTVITYDSTPQSGVVYGDEIGFDLWVRNKSSEVVLENIEINFSVDRSGVEIEEEYREIDVILPLQEKKPDEFFQDTIGNDILIYIGTFKYTIESESLESFTKAFELSYDHPLLGEKNVRFTELVTLEL